MANFKCKVCQDSMIVSKGKHVTTCESCGSTQTVPVLTNDVNENLYEEANNFRLNRKYDEAISLYNLILKSEPEDADIYYSLLLAEYGVEYVFNHATKEKNIILNRENSTNILDNQNFKLAIQYANFEQKEIIEKEVKLISDTANKNVSDDIVNQSNFDDLLNFVSKDSKLNKDDDSDVPNINNYDNLLNIINNSEWAIDEKNEKNYNKALSLLNDAVTKEQCNEAYNLFMSLGDFKNSREQAFNAMALSSKLEQKKIESDYDKAIRIINNASTKEDCDQAYNIFMNLGDYNDSNNQAIIAFSRSKEFEQKETLYLKACDILKNDNSKINLDESLHIFKSLGNYKDSSYKISLVNDKIFKLEKERIDKETREEALKIQKENEIKAKEEAKRKAKEEELSRQKALEEERLAKLEADRKAKEEEFARQKALEEERLAKLEADIKAKEEEFARQESLEEERLAKLEAERKEKEEKIAKAKALEEERLAKLEAERNTKEEELAKKKSLEDERLKAVTLQNKKANDEKEIKKTIDKKEQDIKAINISKKNSKAKIIVSLIVIALVGGAGAAIMASQDKPNSNSVVVNKPVIKPEVKPDIKPSVDNLSSPSAKAIKKVEDLIDRYSSSFYPTSAVYTNDGFDEVARELKEINNNFELTDDEKVRVKELTNQFFNKSVEVYVYDKVAMDDLRVYPAVLSYFLISEDYKDLVSEDNITKLRNELYEVLDDYNKNLESTFENGHVIAMLGSFNSGDIKYETDPELMKLYNSLYAKSRNKFNEIEKNSYNEIGNNSQFSKEYIRLKIYYEVAKVATEQNKLGLDTYRTDAIEILSKIKDNPSDIKTTNDRLAIANLVEKIINISGNGSNRKVNELCNDILISYGISTEQLSGVVLAKDKKTGKILGSYDCGNLGERQPTFKDKLKIYPAYITVDSNKKVTFTCEYQGPRGLQVSLFTPPNGDLFMTISKSTGERDKISYSMPYDKFVNNEAGITFMLQYNDNDRVRMYYRPGDLLKMLNLFE